MLPRPAAESRWCGAPRGCCGRGVRMFSSRSWEFLLVRGYVFFVCVRRNGITAENQAVRTARAGAAVGEARGRSVPADDGGDRFVQGARERGTLRGALEAKLGGKRKRREALFLRGGFLAGAAKLGLHLRGASLQVSGAEPVFDAARVGAKATEQAGGKDVGARGCDVAALDHVALAAVSGALDEVGAGELADVVVHLLAGKAHAAGEAGGGIGLAQGFEDAAAKRVEGGGGAGVAFDKGDGSGAGHE